MKSRIVALEGITQDLLNPFTDIDKVPELISPLFPPKLMALPFEFLNTPNGESSSVFFKYGRVYKIVPNGPESAFMFPVNLRTGRPWLEEDISILCDKSRVSRPLEELEFSTELELEDCKIRELLSDINELDINSIEDFVNESTLSTMTDDEIS